MGAQQPAWQMNNSRAIGCIVVLVAVPVMVLGGYSFIDAVQSDNQYRKNRDALAGAVRGICTTQYSQPLSDASGVEVSSGMITVRVMLQFEPQSYADVQQVTDSLCQGIVWMLMKAGDNPRTSNTYIFVHARRPSGSVSPTGQTMVRSMGRSMYSAVDDAISFEPDK